VVHPDRERISAAVFHRPCQDAQVGPLPELLKDGNTKARYRSVGYMEFMRRYYSAKLDGRNHLERMKIEL
jgi:isopenicillin N synthase-like dioxygenase